MNTMDQYRYNPLHLPRRFKFQGDAAVGPIDRNKDNTQDSRSALGGLGWGAQLRDGFLGLGDGLGRSDDQVFIDSYRDACSIHAFIFNNDEIPSNFMPSANPKP